ncbi:DUF805 domain-containing protein [Streptomyces sp. ODS05-4]|uniref:DUF805 domain-containing protein n=1 Tax=Streptomyces sp. ODS05-4 TaxID=2944939 RepID=UPI00210CCEC8|nr:DUF805 domain-containing protein [Streptomyces sp. ODS05-4]
MHWYLDVLKKYATFTGRARREEFWMYVLLSCLVGVVFSVVDGVLGTYGLLGIAYSLGVFLPGLAVTVRRLHDTGRSGWWVLIALVPFVGAIVLLVFLVSDGTPWPNAHGHSPKAAPYAPQYRPGP